MKINTGSSMSHATQFVRTSNTPTNNPIPFSSVQAAVNTELSSIELEDFTSMTRKEMFDWMNDQIRSGKMTVDESSPFLAMTMKIEATTGQPVDMDKDSARINFIENARLGIEGARLHNNPDLVLRLQAAIETMLR